jgi:hypothetical protein
MIATTNMVLLASVLASAGLFVALDTAPRKDEAPATFSERFPRPEEMFKPLVRTGASQQGSDVTVNRARKSDKIVGNNKIAALGEFCAEQQWPYIASQCLQRM